MKKRILTAIAVMLLTASCSAGTRPVDVHATTHAIEMATIADPDGGQCSATAIGPQALLTASHCEMPTDTILVDGEKTATIVKLVRDYNDHTIYFLNGVKFEAYATVSLDNLYEQGMRVYMFGNPDGLSDIYREGYIASQEYYANRVWVTLYDLNGWFGDSGSGLFNNKGVVIGVISVMRGARTLKLMGSYPLAFTKAQIAEAAAFSTPDEPKKPSAAINPFAEILKQFSKHTW